MKLPTSDIKTFEYQLNNPNKVVNSSINVEQKIKRMNKNIVIAHPSDATGCGHIRCLFPFNYLNSQFGNDGSLVPFISPHFIYQTDILMKTRSIYFQRTMSIHQYEHVLKYKEAQKKYGFKMVYDLDDFIWDGKNPGECIPDYNLSCTKIGLDVKENSLKIMRLMDTICVSTQFLKDYLQNVKGLTNNIEVVQNTVSKFFWFGNGKRPPIKKTIEKPKVVYTGSPSHYCNIRRLKGDWNNAFLDWTIKNVKDNKIDLLVLGGLPWFFETIKNKIKVINWVNSYQYHLPILRFKPDFSLSPLVPNYFNYSKSNLKTLESSAVGAIAIGNSFDNSMPSPYDDNIVKIKESVSVEQLDEIFNKYKEPDLFNSTIENQYKMLDGGGYWTESPKYIDKLNSIL